MTESDVMVEFLDVDATYTLDLMDEKGRVKFFSNNLEVHSFQSIIKSNVYTWDEEIIHSLELYESLHSRAQ